ncbi:MAG: hypothetical protein SF187_14235 [Deltaproteobacteria bacterium]|nr:hypothetical protein [Deltaproteobacteria bacterium]
MSSRWLVLLLFAGCADLSRGETPEVPDAALAQDAQGPADGAMADDAESADPKPSTVVFADVQPLFAAGCGECHRMGGQAANTTLLLTGDASSDLATLLPYINRNDNANSRLLTKAFGRNHGGGAIWSSGSMQATTVLMWIQQGARP